MCGIFGYVVSEGAKKNQNQLQALTESLFKFSETRGREASGFCMRTPQSMFIHKSARTGSHLLNSDEFKAYTSRAYQELERNSFFSFIGHTRLATNGIQAIDTNNQPVMRDGLCAIHNGIITNVDEVWKNSSGVERECEIDSELIPALIANSISEGNSLEHAVKSLYEKCFGAINTAILFQESPLLLLATNVGSLYSVWSKNRKLFVFASERYILKKLCRANILDLDENSIDHFLPGNAIVFELDTFKNSTFSFNDDESTVAPIILNRNEAVRYYDTEAERREILGGLKRCSRCILPETFPFIEFDEDGVCNYCHSYNPIKLLGEEQLERDILSYPNESKDADCILAFSGGRDSSYAMHYLVKEMGIKPIAYSYDWGMITDLARRNQARMTGELGIEHVLISADIGWKRQNIRKNLMAWLKKPHLGMIPLLMAGDKHFFYYANQLKQQTGVGASVWCANELERAQFKVGLTNIDIRNTKKKARLSHMSVMNRIQLLAFYWRQYLKNPSYLNSSLIDTFTAFISYYVINKDYVYIFKYLPWNENVIDETLIENYDWETAKDTDSTWRIGDGTAAFYNYVYHRVAGFTENDTFRSNQIREGHLTREEALSLVHRDNNPRFDSIKEYLDLINVDINYAFKIVGSMPTLYGYPEKIG